MKGICNVKVIRNGVEVKSVTKQNVLFDIPKLMMQEYFDNIGIIGPHIAEHPGSNNIDILPDYNNKKADMFSGIRIYDESISEVNPLDVKVPILAAGPTRNSSAPAEQAQSYISTSNTEFITQATWTLNKNATIRSLGLCPRRVADNPSNTIRVGLSASSPWNSVSGTNIRRSPGKFINSNKLILEASNYIGGQTNRHPMLIHTPEIKLQQMTFAYGGNTLGGSFGYLNSNLLAHTKTHTSLNYDKTIIYCVRDSTIEAYRVNAEGENAAGSLIKTYSKTHSRFCAVLSKAARDIMIEAVGTTVNIYELSRADNTMTLLNTITAPISLTVATPVNNNYVAFKEGYIVGFPDSDNNVKTYYGFENVTGQFASYPVDTLTFPIFISEQAYADISTPSLPNRLLGCGIMATCWYNTTALNFAEPIELLDGDTFVVTYKITAA